MSQAPKPDERYLKNALQQADSTEEVALRYGVGTSLGLEAHIASKTIRAQHAHIADLEVTHLRELAAYRTTVENLEAERDQAKSAVSGLSKRKDDWKWRAMKAEAELVLEAARTAEEKLRADQMSKQHDTQAALNREAREQLAAIKAAPAPQAQDVQRDAARYRHLRECNSGHLVVV